MQFIVYADLFFLLPAIPETAEPLRINFLLHQFGEQRKCFFTITPNGDSCLYILVYFRGIDIKVNNLSLFGIFIQSARYTIVKAHSYCDQNIAFIGEQVGTIVTMHAQHPCIQWMICW